MQIPTDYINEICCSEFDILDHPDLCTYLCDEFPHPKDLTEPATAESIPKELSSFENGVCLNDECFDEEWAPQDLPEEWFAGFFNDDETTTKAKTTSTTSKKGNSKNSKDNKSKNKNKSKSKNKNNNKKSANNNDDDTNSYDTPPPYKVTSRNTEDTVKNDYAPYDSQKRQSRGSRAPAQMAKKDKSKNKNKNKKTASGKADVSIVYVSDDSDDYSNGEPSVTSPKYDKIKAKKTKYYKGNN